MSKQRQSVYAKRLANSGFDHLVRNVGFWYVVSPSPSTELSKLNDAEGDEVQKLLTTLVKIADGQRQCVKRPIFATLRTAQRVGTVIVDEVGGGWISQQIVNPPNLNPTFEFVNGNAFLVRGTARK